MHKSRTLMVQAAFPKNLWRFAVIKTIVLISRLPSKNIGLIIPIELMEKLFWKVR